MNLIRPYDAEPWMQRALAPDASAVEISAAATLLCQLQDPPGELCYRDFVRLIELRRARPLVRVPLSPLPAL